jgi:hypothetical protein
MLLIEFKGDIELRNVLKILTHTNDRTAQQNNSLNLIEKLSGIPL